MEDTIRYSFDHPRASFAQRRYFLLQEKDPSGSAHNLVIAARLEGALDEEAFAKSLAEIQRRHDVLRTVFERRDGEIVPIVVDTLPIRLDSVDLRRDMRDPHEALEERTSDFAAEPFDLGRGPLWRTAVYRTAHQQHVILIVLHPIVSDEGSREVLLSELVTLYAEFQRGDPSSFPPLRARYADFAQAEASFLEGERAAAQLAYWREWLGDPPARLRLPISPEGQLADRPTAARARIEVPLGLVRAMKELAHAERATPTMVFLAAYRLLLFHLSGQVDVLVGTPATHRTRPEFEPLMGPFDNTLVHRVRVSRDGSFRELLRTTRDATILAQANQDIPLEKLVEELQPARAPRESPWFSAFYAFHAQRQPPARRRLGRTPLTPLPRGRGERWHVRFDIWLDLVEVPTGLDGYLEYRADRWTAAAGACVARWFELYCEAIVRYPDATFSALKTIVETMNRHRPRIQSNEVA